MSTASDAAWRNYKAVSDAFMAWRATKVAADVARVAYDRAEVAGQRAAGRPKAGGDADVVTTARTRRLSKGRKKSNVSVAAITNALCAACGESKPVTAFRRGRGRTLLNACEGCREHGYEPQPVIEPGDLVHWVDTDGACIDAVYLERLGPVVRLEVEHNGGKVPVARVSRYRKRGVGQSWHRAGETCPGW